MEKVLDSVGFIFRSSSVRALVFLLFYVSATSVWKSHLNARRNKIRTNDRRECEINITR